MRLPVLASALAFASFATAQQSHLSDEQRQEIRALIRDEIRAALKEHSAQTTTVKGAGKVLAPVKTTTDEKKPFTFQWKSLPVQGTTTTKAFVMRDGKVEEVKLDDVTDAQGSFRIVHGDGGQAQRTFKVVKADGTKQDIAVVAEPKFDFVFAKDVEKQALAECQKALEAVKECSEAVEGATEKAGAEGPIEVEVEALPVQVKVKKNKKAKKNKAPKVEKIDTVDDVTTVKINEVLEKLSR